MSLLTPRATYAPFEYEQAFRYTELQQQSHWLVSEISMASDINDWKLSLNETEKNIIGHILKGFTQSEVFIQEYWGQMVGKWFKKPEIQMMAATFSAMEAIHAISYAHLNQSLGLEDFDAFLHEPTAKAKIDRLISTKGKSKEEIAKSLAIFSAFNEGVSLFSSFAILLNFSRFNKLKGVGQIIAFSIKDECFSSDTEILTTSGFKLFSELEENDKVAQFDPKTNEISFVIPSRRIKQKHTGQIVNFTNQKLALKAQVTPGHQMLYRWANKVKDPWKFQSASDLKTKSPHKTIPVSGFANGSIDQLTPHQQLLIAIQADGHVSERYTGERCGTRPITFSLAKQRKIDHLREILKKTGYSFSEKDHFSKNENAQAQIYFTVDVPVSEIIDKTLSWVSLENVSHRWANEFINEVISWDGHIPPKDQGVGNYRYYSSIDLINVDKVQAIAALAGKWATRSLQEDDRSDNFSDIHRLYIHDIQEKRLGLVEKTYSEYDDYVYCVTVPTSAIVVRRKGSVFISGNCLHSDAGCWLFRTFVSEFPEIMTDELKKEIYDAARLTVELEDAFIDKAFSLGTIEGIDLSDMKAFIRFRTNTKLNDLGLKKVWKNIDKEALERMTWFDVLSSGVSHSDFFASRVSDYSKGAIDFSNIWDDGIEVSQKG
jgi:ribonucleotide reductase beta subunit family protein with ferritin-like domain